MSVTVNFSSGSKRENSTKQLTFTDSHSCTFKNGCSLLNPVLLLEINTSTFPTYTAFQIENRYYLVTDITSVRNNLFEISGKIDVLATYKTQIQASTQYVSYSSHKTSIWLPDTRIPVQKNATVASAASTMNFLFTDGGFYVLSVIGKGSSDTGCELWATDITNIRKLMDRVNDWSDDLIDDIYNGDYPWSGGSSAVTYDFTTVESALESFGKMNALTGLAGNAYTSAPSCIRSCIWVPFFIGDFKTGNMEHIYLGQFETDAIAQHCKSTPVTNSATVSIPWQFSDWRRSVCESVYLYLPLVGMVSIPSDEIINESQITCQWSATATDGCVAYRVMSGGQCIGTFGANCSVNYPLGISQQASAGEIVQSFASGVSKVVSNGLTAKLSPTDIGTTRGEFGAITSAISGAYDVINTALTNHNSCVGGIGGGAGVGLSLDLICFTVAHPTVIAPDLMQATMGLPTMSPMSLSTLTGYCQCANAHLDVAATETEMSIIDNYLNSGFFIE